MLQAHQCFKPMFALGYLPLQAALRCPRPQAAQRCFQLPSQVRQAFQCLFVLAYPELLVSLALKHYQHLSHLGELTMAFLNLSTRHLRCWIVQSLQSAPLIVH